MTTVCLAPLDHVAYHDTIQTSDPTAILWAFVGQILAFHAVLATEYAHLLRQVTMPALFADLFSGMDPCLMDRLTLTPQQYLAMRRSTLIDYYTAQWPTWDARLIVAGVCNATYRLVGISLRGSLDIYVRVAGDADHVVLLPLHTALTTVMDVFTTIASIIPGSGDMSGSHATFFKKPKRQWDIRARRRVMHEFN